MCVSVFSSYKYFILYPLLALAPMVLIAQGTSLSEDGNDFKNDCFQPPTIQLTNGENTIIGRVGGEELPDTTDFADYINFIIPSEGTIQSISIETSNGTPTNRSFLALWEGPDCVAPVMYANIENNNTELFSNHSNNGTLTLRGVDAEFDYIVSIVVANGLPVVDCNCQIALQADWINDVTPSTELSPAQLIDEQNTLPICGDGGSPSTTWGNDYAPNGIPPAIMEINFPQAYLLDTFYLFDHSGIGDFKIEYLDLSDNWQLISTYSTARYLEWVVFSDLNASANAIRLTQLDNNANVAEIGICGQPIIEECAELLTIDSLLTTSAIYEATTIISSSLLSSNIGVQYQAATSITLNAGFHAVAGTSFSATIAPCATNVQTAIEEVLLKNKIGHINNSIPIINPSTTLSAYPNPFQTSLQIDYTLSKKGSVQLLVVDYLGQLVQTIVADEVKETGTYQASLTSSNLSAGTYFLLLQNEEQVLTEKIILLK